MGRILVHIPKEDYPGIHNEALSGLMGMLESMIDERAKVGPDRSDYPIWSDFQSLRSKGYAMNLIQMAAYFLLLTHKGHELYFYDGSKPAPGAADCFNAIIAADQQGTLLSDYNNAILARQNPIQTLSARALLLSVEAQGRVNVPLLTHLKIGPQPARHNETRPISSISFEGNWLGSLLEDVAHKLSMSDTVVGELNAELSAYKKLYPSRLDSLKELAQAAIVKRLRTPLDAERLKLPDGLTIPDALKKDIKQRVEKQVRRKKKR